MDSLKVTMWISGYFNNDEPFEGFHLQNEIHVFKPAIGIDRKYVFISFSFGILPYVKNEIRSRDYDILLDKVCSA